MGVGGDGGGGQPRRSIASAATANCACPNASSRCSMMLRVILSHLSIVAGRSRPLSSGMVLSITDTRASRAHRCTNTPAPPGNTCASCVAVAEGGGVLDLKGFSAGIRLER